MTNPTTAELVEIIRDIAGKLQGVDQYDSLAVYTAADRLEELEDAQNVLKTGLKAINNRLVYIGAVKANAETSILLPEPPKEDE